MAHVAMFLPQLLTDALSGGFFDECASTRVATSKVHKPGRHFQSLQSAARELNGSPRPAKYLARIDVAPMYRCRFGSQRERPPWRLPLSPSPLPTRHRPVDWQ